MFKKINFHFDAFLTKILLVLIFLFIFYSVYSALIVGLSWDEIFHYFNGSVRFNYLLSLGDFKQFDYLDNKFYPGLYDTIKYFIGYLFQIINKNFFFNYFAEISHIINLLFSFLSLFGLYLIVNIFFGKNISLISVFLTLSNPFFFGHMSINPKDTIIFFSLIWFCYFFYKYLYCQKNTYYNLFATAFFVGFGCGVRITFVAVIIPLFIIGLIYFFKKSTNYFKSVKQLLFHLLFVIFISLSLTVITWPHILSGSANLLGETIVSSIKWSGGAVLGLINGIFYETQNTPSNYFFEMIKYKIPFFLTFLYFLSYLIFFLKKNFYNTIILNFNIKFTIVNILIFFPILISLFLSVKIYDYLRLFLFILPFVSILSALSLYYFLKTFYDNFFNKLIILIIGFLYLIFLYRFIILTPYHYSYVNFYFHKLESSLNKFEHDYWGTSLKELIVRIKNNYSYEDVSKFKFFICGADTKSTLYYLNKYLNINEVYNYQSSTHIIMINRAHFNTNDKRTCFTMYSGTDLVSVKRDDLLLSTMRKKAN